MSREIVRLTTADVGKGIPITDTTIISEIFGIEHKSLIVLVRKYKDELKELGTIRDFKSPLAGSKRKSTVYELSESQFSFLIMLTRNNEKTVKFKLLFAKEFFKMKKELLARVETRYIGISVRKKLTDTIKNCVTDDGNFKNYAYSNYSRLVLKKILGKKVKKVREERGLKEKDNIRNFLTIEELEKVQELESKIATFIEFTDNADNADKEIYQQVKNYIEK